MPVLVHLALIRGRTGARVPSQLPPRTKPVRSRAEGESVPARRPRRRRPECLPLRPLAAPRLPGWRPCFAPASFYVWKLSLSRSDGCCILQPSEQRRAPVQAACGSGSGPPRQRPARQLAEWKQLGRNARRCARCSVAEI